MSELADLIELNIVESIERVAIEVSDMLGVSRIGVVAALRPYIRPHAEAFAASWAAGESEEQLAERIAALHIKES